MLCVRRTKANRNQLSDCILYWAEQYGSRGGDVVVGALREMNFIPRYCMLTKVSQRKITILKYIFAAMRMLESVMQLYEIIIEVFR